MMVILMLYFLRTVAVQCEKTLKDDYPELSTEAFDDLNQNGELVKMSFPLDCNKGYGGAVTKITCNASTGRFDITHDCKGFKCTKPTFQVTDYPMENQVLVNGLLPQSFTTGEAQPVECAKRFWGQPTAVCYYDGGEYKIEGECTIESEFALAEGITVSELRERPVVGRPGGPFDT